MTHQQALQDLTDEQILAMADPLLDNIIAGANASDYDRFSRDFHEDFAKMIDAENFARQSAQARPMHGMVSEDRQFLRCLRNEHCVMVLWIGQFEKLAGEILTGINLREFDGEVKVVGVWHHY